MIVRDRLLRICAYQAGIRNENATEGIALIAGEKGQNPKHPGVKSRMAPSDTQPFSAMSAHPGSRMGFINKSSHTWTNLPSNDRLTKEEIRNNQDGSNF